VNEKVLEVLRNTRTGLQILVEPIDHLARFMNYKKGYPPLWIRQKVGSLNDFEGSGGEYMAYLKVLCDLMPGDTVLDIGCGCGLMCLPVNENPTLPQFLYPGNYIGIDIDEKLVDWCEKHLSNENAHFYWIGSSQNFRMDASYHSLDVVLAKSLFTHLLLSETVDYMVEIKRLLNPLGGRGLLTFFLLNEEERKGRYKFERWDGVSNFCFDNLLRPRAAVAYKESWVVSHLKEIGFSVDIYYGSWRGDNKGLSFQDIIILRR
jgi:ubiquinone/menaquinone biosynthesis C-methylase UbiE